MEYVKLKLETYERLERQSNLYIKNASDHCILNDSHDWNHNPIVSVITKDEAILIMDRALKSAKIERNKYRDKYFKIDKFPNMTIWQFIKYKLKKK